MDIIDFINKFESNCEVYEMNNEEYINKIDFYYFLQDLKTMLKNKA